VGNRVVDDPGVGQGGKEGRAEEKAESSWKDYKTTGP
jgi:hypothetical protein